MRSSPWHAPTRSASADSASGMGARSAADPHNLSRFTSKQRQYHGQALRELQAGRKQSCWSWYILPTPPLMRHGMEAGSGINREYAIRSAEEAGAYLRCDPLPANYVAIMQTIADRLAEGVAPNRLLGIDVPRLVASTRFFEGVAKREGHRPIRAVCRRVMRLMELEVEGSDFDDDEGEGGEATAASGAAAGGAEAGERKPKQPRVAPQPKAAAAGWISTAQLSEEESRAVDEAIEADRARDCAVPLADRAASM